MDILLLRLSAGAKDLIDELHPVFANIRCAIGRSNLFVVQVCQADSDSMLKLTGQIIELQLYVYLWF